jgi:hypothetical protein
MFSGSLMWRPGVMFPDSLKGGRDRKFTSGNAWPNSGALATIRYEFADPEVTIARWINCKDSKTFVSHDIFAR